MVAHVHGSHTQSVSDGLPDAWWLPDAVDLPEGIATRGSMYGSVLPAVPGEAVFRYANDLRAATRRYHDHTLGMTRLNVYAGPVGFWLVRDAEEDALDLPRDEYEIPLAIQDRSFWDEAAP